MLEPKSAAAIQRLQEVQDLSGILFKYNPGHTPGIHIPWEHIGARSQNGPNGEYIFTTMRLFNTPEHPYGKNSYLFPNPPVTEDDLIARPFCTVATSELEDRKLFWVPEMVLVTFVDPETNDNADYLRYLLNPNLMSIWEQRAALVMLMSNLCVNRARVRKLFYADKKDRMNNRRLYSSMGKSPERRFFTSMGYFIFEEV